MSKVYLVKPNSENKRIAFGIEKLADFLKEDNFDVEYITEEDAYDYRKFDGIKVYAGNRNDSGLIKKLEETKELYIMIKLTDRKAFI